MLKSHEDRGETNMYSFFSLSTMDDASKKLFAKVYAQTKASKKADTSTKDFKKDTKPVHHKNVKLH